MTKYIKFTVLIVLLAVAGMAFKLKDSGSSQDYEWKKISPFTDLRFEDEKIIAKFEGTFYELDSIEKITTADLIKAAKKEFGTKWQKRIREDIAEVLIAAGAPETTTVELELRDLDTGVKKSVTNAEMTYENRQLYYNPS